jgi:hypothetical protein
MMKSSMPMDEAADKRPIVPGTSIPFLRADGNGDMDSGTGKYLAGNVELPIVADDAAAPTIVAIDMVGGKYDCTRKSCGTVVYLSSAQESLGSPSFLHRNADESGPAETATARLLDRQRLWWSAK